jgi:hypothetical protein
MLIASTAPRIALTFRDCKREDWLEWNVQRTKEEIERCMKNEKERVALKAVDKNGEIAGYGVWSWVKGVSAFLLGRWSG